MAKSFSESSGEHRDQLMKRRDKCPVVTLRFLLSFVARSSKEVISTPVANST